MDASSNFIIGIGNEIVTQTKALVPRLGAGFIVFLGFWIASLILEKFIMHFGKRARHNEDIVSLLGRVGVAGMLVFGIVTALGTIGINVSALVAGLGLTGFALGFAFKDALSNVLAGVMLLIYRPFRRNDQITVMGLEGRVTEINLRYTVLQNKEKRMLIPNSSLVTNPVIVMEKINEPSPQYLSKE